MGRTGKTAQEFIRDSFSPIIAVLCSPKVENVVSKNNLTFTELLQPFTTMEWEGQFREPGGSVCMIKNWRLIIRDVYWKPLQPTEARRQLNNAALHNYSDKTVSCDLGGRKFDTPQSTHWFDAWRETYLEVQFPSDHEFTKHFLSCIIVGVAHDETVIDSFNTMNQQYAQLQNVTPPKLPKWFNSGVLKSYLLIHDASVISREKADVTFETLKQTFGASNCFILSINSKSASDPILTDLWAPYVKRTSESNQETMNLRIWFLFQLNTFTRSRDTGLDRRSDGQQSDPIEVPFFPFENEMSSLFTQAASPAEPQTVFIPPTISTGSEDGPGLTSSVQADNSHPLTSPDNDFYDNANSLQTHSFSGSSESVSVMSKVLDITTEVHGTCLNMNDIDDIKKFLQNYSQKALLPYLEKLIGQLSEVVANRKGVSRSFFTAIATKRWFGTGKAGNSVANNTVIYTADCPELQLRRLGDLWFMCGQWQRAFDAYHAAKREFYADSAFLFYAGALEMAALSAFMAGDANRKTYGYMEESIVTYLNTCRMVQYAVRATLVSAVCLIASGQHGEAAKQLIRMTSEDSDLRSAMLLEQAALCFLPPPRPMPRKYAFHMVLAGHRFSKAGQKKHAYRCYIQAYQVYGVSGWRLATDHVQFALGRLASALRRGAEALRWLRAPLAPPPPATSHHQHQQHAFLREYMNQHQQWVENSEEFKDRQVLPELPLPLVEKRGTTVLCIGPAPLSSPGRQSATSLSLAATPSPTDQKIFARLEEMLLQVAQGSVPMIFKPTVDLYSDATDCDPLVPQGEPIQISITVWNPLNIPIVLKDLELLWRFVPSSDESSLVPEVALNNEPAIAAGGALENSVIYGQKVKSVMLDGDSKKALTFTLTPLRVGNLSVHGMAYKLVNVGEGGNENGTGITITGKVVLTSGVKSIDRRLQITVIPEAPCLQMRFSETSPEILSGELRCVEVELHNAGPVDLSNLHLAVSHPECVALAAAAAPAPCDGDFRRLYEDKYREATPNTDERAARAAAWRALAARHVTRVPWSGSAGGARATLQLRASPAAPALHLLAYYETGVHARPYRLLRHVYHARVAEAVEVSVTPRRNLCTKNGNVLENMTLAVEVKNILDQQNDMSVELLEATLLGRQWRLTSIVATGCKDDALLPRERLHFILKAKRILDVLPEGVVDHSDIQISERDYRKFTADVPPYYRFVTDGKPTFPETNESIMQEPKEKKGLIESMFLLRWKATDKTTGRVAIGQECLWLNCISKPLSNEVPRSPAEPVALLDDYDNKLDYDVSNNKVKNDNVVIFGLEHSSEISHDFKKRKLCLVPITLNIVNCYGVPVKVFIDMTKQKNRESSGSLGWAGALSSGGEEGSAALGVSVSLERFESRRVPVRAVCAAPGTYLVGATFTVSTASPAPSADLRVAHLNNNTSLLVVQAA